MNTHLGRSGAITAALVAAGVLLAACGSAGSSPSASGPITASSGPQAPPGTTAGFGPAASGKIAAFSGKTVQVQSRQSGQVAVTYSAKTRFSRTVATTLAKIKKGDCVTALAPSGTSASATTFTAARIMVTSPVNGSCTGGFGGQRPAGNLPSGAVNGGQFPNGAAPSGAPSGGQFPARTGGLGAAASGRVNSVSGSAVVVAARQFGSTSTKSVTVRSGSSTTVTTTSATTAKALRVGKCLTAQGRANSSGAVQATRIQVDAATNGQCSLGLGGPGGR